MLETQRWKTFLVESTKLRFIAIDNVGNIGSETIAFTISEPEAEPFPTTLVATASVIAVAVFDIGLIVYFKKRKH